MARKKEANLEQARNKLKADYKRGKKPRRGVLIAKITDATTLSEVDLAVKQTNVCYLKAAEFSHSYIADALNLSKSIVKEWLTQPEMIATIAAIQQDYADGAVKLLKTYAIELIEMLVEIARTSDDTTALRAITEGIDRIGISKVNKSESLVLNNEKKSIDLTDKTGLVEALRDAPVEIQQAAARKAEELQAMISEGVVREKSV